MKLLALFLAALALIALGAQTGTGGAILLGTILACGAVLWMRI